MLYLAKMYDTNKDGLLSYSEMEEFFSNFYRFNSHGCSENLITLRAKNFVDKVLIVGKKQGQNVSGGVGLSWFSSLDKSMF